MTEQKPERLAKMIAAYGYCSRRRAEELILAGEVTLNGEEVRDVVTFVTSNDMIEVQQVPLHKPKVRLWKYYKPRGLVTTHKDELGRPTVFDNLSLGSHVISVGRLDIDSEGLLLLTNSGEVARKFELPENNFARIYKVKAYGKFSDKSSSEMLAKLEGGIEKDGVKYKCAQIEHVKSNKTNHWFIVTIFEGKNREIRNMFEFIGMQVNRLIRLSYGEYELDDMKPGEIREVKDAR